MAFVLTALKETQAGERRTAVTPTTVPRLQKIGADIRLASGCGESAQFADALYSGCRIEADQEQLLRHVNVLLAVHLPPLPVIRALKPGTVLLSFIHGANVPDQVRALRDGRISAFAMEQIPRISRAQTMDALSSQAALAGYIAVLLGAAQMPRILPMMTTAAGSLRAAKVLVMGLGVAGLQALATARRLGAVTEGYDVRPATREEAQSLGAKFVDTGIDARAAGGYARELTEEEKAKVAEVIGRHIAEADLIVTAASVPGRPAPRLVSAAQIAAMKPGSVIVDIGAESGGNCEGTEPGATVVRGPVTILGPLNLPSMVAQHASELYAKNLLNLLSVIVKDGAPQIDLADEIVAATLLTHDGTIRNPAVLSAIHS
ncbi:MAG TPA: NAD(P) transhydrogenase subunit alpha [Acidisoma sp.]|uniref:NAD(P) transhydrogenase subunit alpha n=1 Tax=Acidisoma sp. TaxID=1872115 RepID=UPI002CB36C01|nr:NAD(P) transhydrogenase subunit alpha [Acidisoma sp.]HTI01680.1 NAD(P) transhydrogenase subunit alpha [Acidisoma sp.]